MKKLFPAILLFAALPLFAQRDTTITIYASQVEMQGENEFDTGVTSEFEDGQALGASVNFHVARIFSVEAAAFGIRSDAGLLIDGAPAVDLGSVNLTPITLGVQLHPFGRARFDPYIGAGGAYVLTDELQTPDLDAVGLGRIEVDDEATYYLNAGIGVQITEGFGIVLDGRYIPYEPTTRSSVTGIEQEIEFSPRMLSLGVRLRF